MKEAAELIRGNSSTPLPTAAVLEEVAKIAAGNDDTSLHRPNPRLDALMVEVQKESFVGGYTQAEREKALNLFFQILERKD